MRTTAIHIAIVLVVIIGAGGAARAGAPTPDIRASDFAHVCKGGANKGLACTVATADTDCPNSDCIAKTLGKIIKGTLTIIAADDVRDWAQGTGGNQALTLLLEVKAPDGTKQMLAGSYQDLAFPSNAPQALSNVVTIDMNETNLANLAAQVGGLVFAQPESVLAQRLQALFSATGVPVIVGVNDKQVRFADHTGDGLATVLRFKVKIQFVEPA